MLLCLLDLARLQELVSVMGTRFLDDLVRASSQTIRERVGPGRTAYHVGVVSYAVLMDESVAGPWQGVMAELADALAVPVISNGIPVQVAPTFGISSFVVDTGAAVDALRTGFSAANEARAKGVDHAVYSPASDAANRRRLTLLGDFASALSKSGELSLVYQPRIDLRTGRLAGAEALLRWRHPTLGDIPPAEFVPLVEQTALARPMTEWVLGAALEQQAAWRAEGTPIVVSVNVSARNLEEADFLERLTALALRTLPPRPWS